MSTVIKAGQAGKILKRLAAVDLADHLAEARAVVDDARRRASDLVSSTQREINRIVPQVRRTSEEEGYAAGYEKGFREGREAGTEVGHKEAFDSSTNRFNEEQSAIISDLEQVISQIDDAKEELMIAAKRHVLEFSVLLGRKLTFAIGSLHRESAIANLNRALDLVGTQTNLTVRVHPKDLAAMERFAQSALQSVHNAKAVRFVVDPSVSPGGCTVRNEQTEVDATLETQVDEITSLLLGCERREDTSDPSGRGENPDG